ncbi:MAG: hypothetical protein HY273_15030 [Gammaproteobacteria bacterium]|nr:hypothetical protein [Gammaproteobacteria bacterium]
MIIDTSKSQEHAPFIGAGVTATGNQPIAPRKQVTHMSETSKRELVIAFAAVVMLIVFFTSGTP